MIGHRSHLQMMMTVVGGLGLPGLRIRLRIIAAIPGRLERQERPVERQRDQSEKDRLGRRQAAVGRGTRVARQDERDGGNGDENTEESPGTFEIVGLLVVADAADQQSEADHPVQNNDEDREHGVAGEHRIGVAVQHHRGDHRHFDADHGDGEDQRAIRLAEELGKAVGMAHDPEGAPHHDREDPDEQPDQLRRVVEAVEPILADGEKDRRRDGAGEKGGF